MKRRNNLSTVANNTASDQPSNLEQGLFCDGCLGNANSCYWHCEICLDGAWGYCQTCVAQGKHCTHPLEAMALKSLLCLDTGSPHPPSPPAISSSSPPPDLSSNFSHISSTIKITSPPSSPPQPSNGPLQTNPSAGVGINEIVRVPSILRLRTKLLPSLPNPESYAPLLLPCDCDICHRAIPSSSPRYHCYTCSNGDYDICQSCYATLCSNGKIKPEDAAQGWRRCPQGHRTVMVGFEERERGLRRVVLRDLVGGWALKEDPSAAAAAAATQEQERERERAAGWRWKEQDGRESQAPFAHGDVGVINVQGGNALLPQRTSAGPMVLPPDGGVGLRVQALWSYFPAEGVEDELAFPKHAEVREAENINGDWFWGVFAGRKGLFPGNYGRVVGY
ncbi:putative zinc ion binding protein 1 [Elsinoe australis]|uniref:Putative zinc ion binding protein 1 n=1 Tax=Elsinoe australis TaxID=40998 RepID=A0A4U7B4K2_9PEZI|nr:putative zinc ion binding protein 1 [Elsinoe australis]